MAEVNEPKFPQLLEALKKVAATLRDADVPFLLAGGMAAWARGGPPTEHDIDLAIKPDDAERALQALADAGLRTEKPPEEWLYKAWDGECLIDLVFYPARQAVDDAMFERAEEMSVHAVTMPVMTVNDVMAMKLLAMREHELDYDSLLELARALREQIDWEELERRTKESPFAMAFFTLAEGLGLTANESP